MNTSSICNGTLAVPVLCRPKADNHNYYQFMFVIAIFDKAWQYWVDSPSLSVKEWKGRKKRSVTSSNRKSSSTENRIGSWTKAVAQGEETHTCRRHTEKFPGCHFKLTGWGRICLSQKFITFIAKPWPLSLSFSHQGVGLPPGLWSWQEVKFSNLLPIIRLLQSFFLLF